MVTPQNNKVAVVTYNTDMAKMNRMVAEIRQAMTGSSISMGGHTFSSIVDATVFAQQHLLPTCYQSFVDIMSLLHCIDGHCVYSHEVQQSEIHQSKVNRLPEQSTVVASFQTDLPPLLQGPKESYDNLALFGAMKSYAAWDAGDGIMGTLNQINATLDM